MKNIGAVLFVGLVAAICGPLNGCAGSEASPPVTSHPVQKVCSQPVSGVYGVKPLGNKSGKPLDVGGTDDLLINELHNSGCFSIVERDKLAVLVEEIRLCDQTNPDRAFFDCGSFAKKGKLLGISHLVVGDVVFVEPNVKGAQLAVKIPGIGGIEMGRTYSALAVELRVVEVETGKVAKSAVIHAEVPSDSAGVTWDAASGLSVEAAVRKKTPFGVAVQQMFAQAVAGLK